MKRKQKAIGTVMGLWVICPTFSFAQSLIETVEIPSGTFYMGSTGVGEDFDEAPVHRVTISHSFRMGKTEVTNAQFEQFRPEHRALRGKNGVSTEDDDAVVNVTYQDAVDFCNWLSRKEGKTYRLPTEAEWEYACRAGTYTDYYTGDYLPESMCRNQVIARNYKPVSLKVGQTVPNAFGLYDMHGNVEEWCLDWYAPYAADEQTDPTGPETGLYRVTRGGSHHTPVQYLRSANRMAMLPEDCHSLTGFRVVQSEIVSNRKQGKVSFVNRFLLWLTLYFRESLFTGIIISLPLRGATMEICWLSGSRPIRKMVGEWSFCNPV